MADGGRAEARHTDHAAISARAPGRVNLIGDHTDYTGGLAFPMAIDRWTEVTGTTADRIVLSSADDETTADIGLDSPVDAGAITGWDRYVAAVVAELQPRRGIRGTVTTTIPIGAGLSSSAALEVALALALGFSGTPADLAALTQRAEHRATGVPTGIMDQLCIASAKSGHATMIDCHTGAVDHVPIADDVVVVVRFVAQRTLEGSEYAERVSECATAERVIGPLRLAGLEQLDHVDDPRLRRRARHVISENQRVQAFADALRSGDHAEAGRLMTDSHASLRDDYQVSTPQMDAAVDALNADPTVFGARMTGGGFGGCIVALCRPDTQATGWRVRPVDAAARQT